MRKKILAGLLAALMLLSLAGCGGGKTQENTNTEPAPQTDPAPQQNTQETEPVETPDPEPEPVLNPLTGLPLADPELVNARPVAVMLNDLHADLPQDSMPQHGIEAADMIFEYEVEYGITRMVAFFQEPQQVGTIGSVRSARACFVETVLGMDAIYFHAGGSSEAMSMIYQLDMDEGDEDGSGLYWRDQDRANLGMAYEHTLMTSGPNILQYIENKGFRTEHYEGYEYPIHYVDDATPVSGETAKHINVSFSGYKSAVFDYNEDTGLYEISQSFSGDYPDPYVDGNSGNQVAVSNVLVLRTVAYNSGDAAGHMVFLLQGGGSGTYFCGGKCEDISWYKGQMSDPFTFYHADGTPLDLQKGHTYVCVIREERPVDYN